MQVGVRVEAPRTIIVLTPESLAEASELTGCRSWSVSGSGPSQGFKPGRHLWTYSVESPPAPPAKGL